jgi:4-amino-4-deoxy-L-arabinose transferase-like glycosyltransferase
MTALTLTPDKPTQNHNIITGLLGAITKLDIILIAILVFAFLVRLYGIESPLADFSSWRQVDTTSIARFFAENGFNIFHPQLLYDGPGPNYTQLELQITTFLIAILFKFAGMRELYARIIPVLFFTGSALLLFLFIKKLTDRPTALLSTLVYSVLPMGIYYSRTVQPESSMLFFGIAALYTFLLWLEKKSTLYFVLAVIVGCLSVLAKLPNAFLLLPIAIMAIGFFGKKAFKVKLVYAYFAIVLIVATGYFVYLGWFVSTAGSEFDYRDYLKTGVHAGSFVSDIASRHIIPQILTAATSNEGQRFLVENIVNMVATPIGFVLMLLGLLLTLPLFKPKGNLIPIYGWLASVFLFVMTIASVIKIDYYLVPILPIAAFFIAYSLRVAGRAKLAWPVIVLVLGLIGYQSYIAVSPLYALDNKSYMTGIELSKSMRPHEPIILGTYNPLILFYSNHNGWRSADLSLEEFLFLKSKGASYYVPLNSAKDSRLVEYLDNNFHVQSTNSGCKYYDLKNKFDSQ